MTFKVLAISGSLRKNSTNSFALKALQKIAPPDITIEIANISEVPMYNGDLYELGEPQAVTELKLKIRQADAIVIATPEYNFSVPAVLKNVLDWVSRPPEPPFNEKPVAILGVSPGPVGTARVQYHLRQILVFMNTFTLNKPEVFINHSAQKFDSNGELTDEQTKKFLLDQLLALKILANRVKVSDATV
jgi:chromate reductase